MRFYMFFTYFFTMRLLIVHQPTLMIQNDYNIYNDILCFLHLACICGIICLFVNCFVLIVRYDQ